MKLAVLGLVVLVPAASAQPKPTTAAAGAIPKPALTKVADFKHQVTGVTVAANNRIFVNFPRWSEDTAISVAELRNGELVPYPDAGWNAWRNAKKDQVAAKDHWVCVQSVVADHAGNLWVLDPAAPAQDKVVKDGPKLVEINLRTNKVARTIPFDETIAPQGSYLNDVRFSPDDKTAYITDSGAKGAIVVVDLGTGKSHRALDGDPSTQPDKTVTVTSAGKPLRAPDGRGVEFAADGIALSPDGKHLYWQAIRGKTLYRIPTDALASPDAATKVEKVGENGVADGLWIAPDNVMYITSPEDSSIKVRDLAKPTAKPSTLLTDPRLRWPDTFSQSTDGTLYVTTSHIQDSAKFKPGAPIELPTELWSIKLK